MSRRTKLELSTYEAQVLAISTRAQLQFHGIGMTDETPHAISDAMRNHWYSETSQVDNLVRLYARLNRILTGHKQFNAVIPYTRRPTP